VDTAARESLMVYLRAHFPPEAPPATK
jgi:hypothetical protein